MVPTGFIWIGARYYDPKTGRFLSPDPIGHPYNLNLYTFANGDPINYFDPDGRFFIEAWHNPRVQGTLQTIGGISETVAGGMTAYFSGGFAAPLGFAVMAHGLDHTITGLRAITSGQYQDSATTQLLQKTGMSHNAASNVDAFLGFSGVTCSFKAFNAATRQAFPQFRLPANYNSPILESNDQILFAQSSVGKCFSKRGSFEGKYLSEVVKGLRNGTISPKELPIEIIVRDGKKITLNNRSLLALKRANMKPQIIIDRTGDPFFEEILNLHLGKVSPSNTIKIRGGKPGTSFIGIDF